jgi:hypothetical protein
MPMGYDFGGEPYSFLRPTPHFDREPEEIHLSPATERIRIEAMILLQRTIKLPHNSFSPPNPIPV